MAGLICDHTILRKQFHWLFSVKADNPTQEMTPAEMTPAEMLRALRAAEADREKMKKEMEEFRLEHVTLESRYKS